MSPSQQPDLHGHTNGTASSRRSRPRSTIGVNPLDLGPIPASADTTPSAPADRDGPAGDAQPTLAGVVEIWASGTENILKAVFESQHAALQANLSVLESSANLQRQLGQDWARAARLAQAAALRAFHAGLPPAPPSADAPAPPPPAH